MPAKRLVWLRALASLFAAVVATYSILWIWHTSNGVPGIGVPYLVYHPQRASRTVRSQVIAGSEADVAGLRQGDQIIAIDGSALRNLLPVYQAIVLRRTDTVDLLVKRQNVKQPFHVRLNTRAAPNERERPLLQSALVVYRLYPLCLVAIGLSVLFLKPDSLDAWRLSILFAGFIALAPLHEVLVPTYFRGSLLPSSWWHSCARLEFFYAFFSVFPSRTPLDRWFPWLKTAFWIAPLLLAGAPAFLCLVSGGARPLYEGLNWPGAGALVGLQGGKDQLVQTAELGLLNVYALAGFGLGMVNLVWNAFLSRNREGVAKHGSSFGAP